eukprot:CAMPEP_0185036924 /NCGR_PEP_ID=MMETSP1103-20130426/30643_1 /TAXON_ID=36769 /ORGANISM="Paraphysomonas bandaiensis, Strain Caron Lab Isolate" /LENGTH=1046 /DNA_ID=CAMNT_0027574687 /DNA_START=186 /DNA_END=3323 /DNA_ORIENTATION=+
MAGLRPVQVDSLERHRSPPASEIYSSAKMYLRNGCGARRRKPPLMSPLPPCEHENHEKSNTLHRGENHSDLCESSSAGCMTVKANKDRTRRVGRQRSTSSESSEGLETILSGTTENRSSLTECSVLSGRNSDSSLEKDGVPYVEVSPNIDMAMLQSTTRLASLSIGRNGAPPITNPFTNSDIKQISSLSGNITEINVAEESQEASIETYIGQTFPRVKDIPKVMAATSTRITSHEKRHNRAQPLPSMVAEASRSQFSPPRNTSEFMNHTPPYEYKGRKPFKHRRFIQPVSGVALDNEDNMKVMERDRDSINGINAKLVNPPSRGRKVSDTERDTVPLEYIPHNAKTDSYGDYPGAIRRLQSKKSGSRESSPPMGMNRVAKGGTQSITQCNDLPTSSAQDFQNAPVKNAYDQKKTKDSKASDLDSIVKERLQQAKAENRKNSSDGATMYKFSLWSGVQRRDPLVEPAALCTDAVSFSRVEQSVSISNKKCSDLQELRTVGDTSQESTDSMLRMRLMKIKSLGHNSQGGGSIQCVTQSGEGSGACLVEESVPSSKFSPWKQSRDYYAGGVEVEDDSEADEEVLSEDGVRDSNGEGGGRALAFRSMVGSCKVHESSMGSVAESIQTERGVIGIPLNTKSMDSVGSNNYLSDEFEEVEDEVAILGIAVDDYSLASDEVEDSIDDCKIGSAPEQKSDIQQRPELDITFADIHNNESDLTILVASSLDQVGNFSPNHHTYIPPPIQKGNKLVRLFDEIPCKDNFFTRSVSPLPTERRDPRKDSSIPLHDKKAGERNHREKKRHENAVNCAFYHHRDQTSSPTLSELSDIDSSQIEYPNKTYVANPVEPHQQPREEEVYIIQDFKWKKGVDIIGEGTFGQVFKGMNCATGELLAVKQICLVDGSEEEVSNLRREIDLMQNLSHPNIVRYIGTSVSSRYLFIVLEYVPGGCVAGMLAQFGAFSEVLIRRLVSQIIQGIDYLHQKGIVHRDVKGANVLVTNSGVAKLADFGCSKQLAGLCTTSLEESMRTIRGSVPWMAPEVIKQNGHGRSADIW